MSKIRLTENQLHRVIKEAVKKVLKEEEMDELSLDTMSSAYDKMWSKGQYDRARQLSRTARAGAENRGDFFSPNISQNTASYTKNGYYMGKYNADDDSFHEDSARKDGMRTNNPKDAINRARNLKQLNPNTRYNKNDFRS